MSLNLRYNKDVIRTFNNAPAEYKNKLRILWKSDGYTPHAFAAHPRVPQAIVDKLQKALLKKIRLKGIEKGTDREWDDVRALNIQS